MRLVAVLLTLLLSSSSLALRRLVAEFQHNAKHNLSSLVIEEDTGKLFLAGTNVLYQLDDELRVRHRVETGECCQYQICCSDLAAPDRAQVHQNNISSCLGPVLDSHHCSASDSDCRSRQAEAVNTDNHAKVLVVDRGGGQLLLCGSVRQGACYKYELQDISRHSQAILQSVAANTDTGSTFGFIGQ